ncbi:MAG: hypothetical protein IKM59_08085, partial [Oscillospiraceae bacterium]|nr:hypothetical protein [Oscillospiraceae bacterium]
MAREYIKDWTGRQLGYTELRGNRLWLHDWQGKMLAYYDKSTNKTYDWQGKMLTQGNTLMMMLK